MSVHIEEAQNLQQVNNRDALCTMQCTHKHKPPEFLDDHDGV